MSSPASGNVSTSENATLRSELKEDNDCSFVSTQMTSTTVKTLSVIEGLSNS